MSKPRSVFENIEYLGVTRSNGEPLSDGETPPRLQCEMVYKGRRIQAIYIVANGERVAYRGREGGTPAWISMKEDLVFHNGIDAPGNEQGWPS